MTRLLPALALGIPVLFSLWLAHVQAREAEDQFILGYAHGLLRVSERTADQMMAAAAALAKVPRPMICQETGLGVMRRLDLSSTLLQAVGYVEDNHLVCSSFTGRRVIDLGAPDLISDTGDQIRLNVHFNEEDPGFVVIVHHGFLGVIHGELPLSFVDPTPGMTVDIFSRSHRTPLMLRGHHDPAWLATAAADGVQVLRGGARLVAVLHSARHDLSAVAAIPANLAPDFRWRVGLLFIPIGLGTGVACALCVNLVARNRTSLPALIQAGLRRNEFHLLYQPIVDLRDGTTVSAEVLLRWHRRNGEDIPPDVFIAAAEGTPLMARISQQVCRLLRDDLRGAASVFRGFPFAINLSTDDLQSYGTVETLRQMIADMQPSGALLMVEATERGLMDTGSAGQVIAAVRRLGIRVAIDDFGTGNANLGYLTQFQVDTLKIDKLFIGALATQAVTNAVVARIVDLARDLGLRVVAEGVESPAQVEALRGLGVHYGQGWHYARPMSLADLAARVKSERDA